MYHSYSKSSYTKQFNHNFPVRRWLAFLLTVCMLIPMMTPFITAADDTSNLQQAESNITSNTQVEELQADIIQELSPNISSHLLKTESLSNETLPFAMSLNEAEKNGFVGRVKAAENDLHSVVLAKNNGDLTLYYYKDPVKYIDELGQVKDKSDKLYAYKDGSFATIASDIRTDLPKNLADGITLRKDNYLLQLSPEGSTNAIGTLSNDQKVVTYTLNDTTRYEYSLTAMGFKEDIVVSRYTGQTEYTFTLQTHGLTPINENGTYVLVDDDGVHRATLGDVIIFTADEQNNTFGELLVEELTAGEEYQLTIKLDAEWLSDPQTVYPITIDPPLSYVNGDFNIEDMVVGTTTTYSKTASVLYVGRGSSGAQIRTLMCFPNLNIPNSASIISATVSIRDIMCQHEEQTVECYEYVGANWSGSGSFAWNGMGGSPVGMLLDSEDVSYYIGVDFETYKHRYEFDITALAQKWANGTADPSKGVMFKATDDYEESGTKTFKTFASVDRGSNSPWMEVNYASDTPTITLESSQLSLYVGGTATIEVETSPTEFDVEFVSSNPSIASVNSITGVVTGISEGSATITVSADDAAPKTCTVTVSTVGLTLDKTEATMTPGETLQLNAVTVPSGRTVAFVSSNTAVAEISDTGLITAKTIGTTIITVSTNGAKTQQCEVTVEPRIQDIQMLSTNVVCDIDGVAAIDISISPAEAGSRPIVWTTSNPEVATVTNSSSSPQDGCVTGISTGCAILTATGDGHSASIIVYVGNEPAFENGTAYFMLIRNSRTLWKRYGNSLRHAMYNGKDDESYHWYLTCVDNTSSSQYYIITSGYRRGQYLYITNTGELGWSAISNPDLLSAPDAYKWYTDPGGYGFRNKVTGQFISQSSGDTMVLSTNGSDRSFVRYKTVNLFVELTELDVTDLTIPIGGTSSFIMRATDDNGAIATWCEYSDFSYSYSDTSIANAVSSGNTRSLAQGLTNVTITHKLTGNSTTCTVRCVTKTVLEKEDTDTQVGELFFTIENNSSDCYLQASTNQSSSVLVTGSNDPQKDGRYIWRLKQNNNGYYQIVSVSAYRTVNGQYSEAGLAAWSSVYTEAANPSEPKQQWIIEKVSNGYHIINHYNNKYLTLNGSTLTLTLSTSPTSNSLWIIEGIPADQFDAYFGGNITRGWDGTHSTLHVWINVDDSITSAFPEITKDDIRNWALEWDDLGGIISIHTGDTHPNNYYEIKVSARSFLAVDMGYSLYNIVGVSIPNGDNSLPQTEDYEDIDPSVDYTHTHIFLNADTPDILERYNSSISLIDCLKFSFIHEMGHALKLAHPADKNVNYIRYAVMNYEFEQTACSTSVTEYDLMNFLCKWKYGGKNNIVSITESYLVNASEMVEAISDQTPPSNSDVTDSVLTD